MQGIDLTHANEPTYSIGPEWKNKPNMERNLMVSMLLDSLNAKVEVVNVRDSGQIIVSLKENLTASERGHKLMQLESYLKSAIDPGITLWLEPKGDRNVLRAQTRGIVMKEW